MYALYAYTALLLAPEQDLMFKRKNAKSGKGTPTTAKDTVTVGVRPATAFLLTWESELCAIAAEASAWSVETGGDLFGRWHSTPTILLATKAGPSAQRDNAHFRLDVEYLRQLSETLASDWALRYFGDWHSHHRLGLCQSPCRCLKESGPHFRHPKLWS